MLDLTLIAADRKNFITKVYLKEDENKFVVQFADSHTIEKDFTVCDLNETLHSMEEQYQQYKVPYVQKCSSVIMNATLKSILEVFVAIGSIYITSTIPMPDALQAILVLAIVCGSFYLQKLWSLQAKCCEYLIRKIKVVETFLAHKEDFKIKVLDPNTDAIEDWYLLTLSGIEEVEDARLVTSLASSFTDEIREEESLKTTMVLKKMMK